LYGTKWFLSVEPRYRQTDAGLVLIFKVVERPIVQSVEYRGNNAIKTKHLEAITGMKRGSAFDVSANREAAQAIETHYREKGWAFATVDLAAGGSRQDRDVIFEINEGPKVAVTRIKFAGNEDFSGPLLKTKVRTKTAILWVFGGKYDPASFPDDIAALKAYYHSLGYFDVQIKENITFNEANWVPFSKERSHAEVEYIIDEGVRYTVRNIDMYGMQALPEGDLRNDMKLMQGEFFNGRYLGQDVQAIKDKYGELGRLFATVDAVPRFLEEPGVCDIVYQIDEDKVYTYRRVDVKFNGDTPRTKRTVILNRVLTRPGELANAKDIQLSTTRLAGTQFFEGKPQVNLVKVEPGSPSRLRGQNEEGPINPYGIPSVTGRATVANPAAPKSKSTFNAPHWSYLVDPSDREKFPDVIEVLKQADPEPVTIRGQSFGENYYPPQNYIDSNSPQGDPLSNPNEVDVIYNLQEARTGRLMFGVGVNSDAGVVGSIVLSEQNFDLLRYPRSFQDIIDGTAFRGGGQRFRFEAIPGNQVSRYLINWTDPYFLDTDYSLGVSGFYYQRFFQDWDEERGGGRVSVGRQFDPFWSASVALRLENVTITNPDVPTPPSLQMAVGDNFLSTVRFSVVNDTRDSGFLPGSGHKVEVGYEQAFGDFSYPRFDVDARQYFTLYNRPDGGGRHILSLGGQAGWTGDDTPIFENYFAGGFQTFRGFAFRGVGPEQFDVRVGGQFLALGSVEYMFPLLVNESIQAVTFTDFGTVEEDISLDQFRVSVGAGLRVSVPALGPVPLAFDWAVPIIDEDTDDRRIFSFYVGLNR
jgi:outer membrane protein insertion porin family